MTTGAMETPRGDPNWVPARRVSVSPGVDQRERVIHWPRARSKTFRLP
jgi:hypothetical protein